MKWFGARNFVMISFWRLTGGTGMETSMRWFGIKFKVRRDFLNRQKTPVKKI